MSPGTLSLVPCYRMTLLGMTFDIGADNQSEVLALHSPLLDRCVKQVGLGVRTAVCEGFRPQRKAAAEASLPSTSLCWWQFSHSQRGRSVSWERDLAVRG